MKGVRGGKKGLKTIVLFLGFVLLLFLIGSFFISKEIHLTNKEIINVPSVNVFSRSLRSSKY